MLMVAGTVCLGGCAIPAGDDDDLQVAMTPALIFGPRSQALLSTDLPRSTWPSAFDGFATPVYSTFIERYYDRQGSAANERVTPQRWFTAYRFGAAQR